VVQGDHGLDAGVPQSLELSAIVVTRGLVEVASAWLDSRPLDRHAVGVEAHISEQTHVLHPAIPRIARVSGPIRQQTGLFRSPPIAVHVVAFDLVGGGRRAPQEAIWEAHRKI
jgi:hypothetical protein